MDEIKNEIQKRRLGWFPHVVGMGEETIPKKRLHTKMEGKRLILTLKFYFAAFL